MVDSSREGEGEGDNIEEGVGGGKVIPTVGQDLTQAGWRCNTPWTTSHLSYSVLW